MPFILKGENYYQTSNHFKHSFRFILYFRKVCWPWKWNTSATCLLSKYFLHCLLRGCCVYLSMLHNNDWEIFIFCQIIIVIIVIIVIIMLGPHFALFTTTTVTDSMARKQTSVVGELNTKKGRMPSKQLQQDNISPWYCLCLAVGRYLRRRLMMVMMKLWTINIANGISDDYLFMP